MGWKDFYRRRDAIDAVLERAGRAPDGGLPFAGSAAEVFASPAYLLLALHHRWLMALTGRIGVALAEADRDPGIDPLDAVTGAWRTTAAAHPVLRRLLDEGLAADEPSMRPAVEGEQRLLALAAGLAGRPSAPRMSPAPARPCSRSLASCRDRAGAGMTTPAYRTAWPPPPEALQ
jgi:hypothetical protein